MLEPANPRDLEVKISEREVKISERERERECCNGDTYRSEGCWWRAQLMLLPSATNTCLPLDKAQRGFVTAESSQEGSFFLVSYVYIHICFYFLF